MSAIAGVYLLNGKSVDQNDLLRMNERLSHRGPDGSALWCEGPVGIAHQMLWTTPESLHEKLPLEADGLVITSDARIDNRDELLPALGLSEEVTDSEVILKAYGKWGKSCVDRLLGDFAFVIWDKAKKELFCARDHMGVKPFYYYYKPDQIFAFATEIKALFAWGVPKNINEIKIGDYLIVSTEDRESTFYQDILRLPSANFLTLGPHGIKKDQYWELDPKREIKLGSDAEYERAFRDIFREAVKCRLRSAFPVGSHLSGGLDSSSIVCEARDVIPKDCSLKTFSAVFDTVKESDERPYIYAVLESCDIDAYYIYADRIGPLSEIERMLWHEDQPFLTPNLFLSWGVYDEARKQSVRIILDGYDGDTAVSYGKTYITELASKGRFVTMQREIRGLCRTSQQSTRRILMQYAIYPFIPGSLLQTWRKLRGIEDNLQADNEIVNSDFARRIGLIERRKRLEGSRSKPAMTAKEHHWRRLTTGNIPLALEICNAAAAAFSLEIRNPFLDKRMVEFCLALPGDQKIRDGWTRSIMRRALRDILPNKIFNRTGKGNLSHNFSYGLLSFHKAILRDTIFNYSDELEDYVNILKLRETFQRLISFKKLSKDDDIEVWRSVVLAIWLRLNFKPLSSPKTFDANLSTKVQRKEE